MVMCLEQTCSKNTGSQRNTLDFSWDRLHGTVTFVVLMVLTGVESLTKALFLLSEGNFRQGRKPLPLLPAVGHVSSC